MGPLVHNWLVPGINVSWVHALVILASRARQPNAKGDLIMIRSLNAWGLAALGLAVLAASARAGEEGKLFDGAGAVDASAFHFKAVRPAAASPAAARPQSKQSGA